MLFRSHLPNRDSKLHLKLSCGPFVRRSKHCSPDAAGRLVFHDAASPAEQGCYYQRLDDISTEVAYQRLDATSTAAQQLMTLRVLADESDEESEGESSEERDEESDEEHERA